MKQLKLKIAHFVGTLKRGDGVGKVILKITEGSNRRNCKSAIVTGWAEEREFFPAKIIKVPSVIFPLYHDYHFPLPGTLTFKSKLEKFSPHLIHVHSPDLIAWAALNYAQKAGIPVIATHHTDFIKYLPYYHLSLTEPVIWLLLRKLYNQMAATTAPSPIIAEELRKHGVRNVVVLPWGVDLKKFNPRFRSEEWRKKVTGRRNKPILFCASRLAWEKDFRTLVQTYQLLKKHKVRFALAIAGEGPIQKELRRLMPEAVFLGYLGGRALATAYASADVFVFPSTTETFGNVTNEAMASGLVPIAARAGGSASIIEHKVTGLLAKPKNALDFYKNIIFILQNPGIKEKMREAGLRHIQNFTWDKTLDKLFDLYFATIKKR